MIKTQSLVRGKLVSSENIQKVISPVNGEEIGEVSILSTDKLKDVFKAANKSKLNEVKEYSELIKLANFFKKHKEKFIEAIILDSGFTYKDSEDLVNGSIEFCEDYSLHIIELSSLDKMTSFSFREGMNLNIKFTSLPYGVIAATTPRNTPLITELTIIVHALWSGNSLVLRPSPGVAGTIELLIEGILKSFNEDTLNRLNITFSDAKDFVEEGLNHANLLHYVGSTKYLENTLITGIKKGTRVLLDGDGCSLVLVDSTVDINEAAKACVEGVTRSNGQICVSIRAIVVEKKIYNEFLDAFLSLIKEIKVGPPSEKSDFNMGPLFSAAQADTILEVAKKYKILENGGSSLKFGNNYINPVVIELNKDDNSFLRESIFGPIVGISHFEGDDWKRWIVDNPINLTDVVFSKNKEFIDSVLKTSKSPRRVVNSDPTLESVFEPWGAYLPSGWNDVSYWYHKYRNYYQLVSK